MLDPNAEEIDAAPMRLMLLRHAKAEKAESGMRDRDRRLNARGRDDAARIAAHMARHALLPDRVIVSSAQRTRETWRSEEHTSELQSPDHLVSRLLLEKHNIRTVIADN